MTLAQLQIKLVHIMPSGAGHYKVTFLINDKAKTAITKNMAAIDRITNRENYNDMERGGRYTLKQAYQALYDEVKAANR